jgi:hypothetical protein
MEYEARHKPRASDPGEPSEVPEGASDLDPMDGTPVRVAGGFGDIKRTWCVEVFDDGRVRITGRAPSAAVAYALKRATESETGHE